MSKFKVGDLVRGITLGTYAYTNSKAVCKVVSSDGDRMRVAVLSFDADHPEYHNFNDAKSESWSVYEEDFVLAEEYKTFDKFLYHKKRVEERHLLKKARN